MPEAWTNPFLCRVGPKCLGSHCRSMKYRINRAIMCYHWIGWHQLLPYWPTLSVIIGMLLIIKIIFYYDCYNISKAEFNNIETNHYLFCSYIYNPFPVLLFSHKTRAKRNDNKDLSKRLDDHCCFWRLIISSIQLCFAIKLSSSVFRWWKYHQQVLALVIHLITYYGFTMKTLHSVPCRDNNEITSEHYKQEYWTL